MLFPRGWDILSLGIGKDSSFQSKWEHGSGEGCKRPPGALGCVWEAADAGQAEMEVLGKLTMVFSPASDYFSAYLGEYRNVLSALEALNTAVLAAMDKTKLVRMGLWEGIKAGGCLTEALVILAACLVLEAANVIPSRSMGLPVCALVVSMCSECCSSTASSMPGGRGAMLEEEKGRASAFVLWSLLPRRALAAVVSTVPCRPLGGSCLGTVFGSIADNLCVASLSQSKVFSTK